MAGRGRPRIDPEIDVHNVTAITLAKCFGVTRDKPGKWIKAGCPHNEVQPPTFSIPQVHVWLVEREKSKNSEGLTETRRKKTDAEWRYKEIALLEKSGELIPLASYVQRVTQAFRMLRDILLSMDERVIAKYPKKYQPSLRKDVQSEVIRALTHVHRSLNPHVQEDEPSIPRKQSNRGLKKSSRRRSKKSTKSSAKR